MDDLVDSDWLFYCPDENNSVAVATDFDAAAKHLEVSRDLLEAVHEALQFMANELISATKIGWCIMENEICRWKYDDNLSMWETACNNAWQFTDGSPKENGVRFCPFCGCPLKVSVTDERLARAEYYVPKTTGGKP